MDNYTFDKYHFLDYTTNIYGASNSGKSTIIKYLLYHMRNDFRMVLVFSESETGANRAYANTLVPAAWVHNTVNEDMITNILTMQTELTTLYASFLATMEKYINYKEIQPHLDKILQAKDNIKNGPLGDNAQLIDSFFKDKIEAVKKAHLLSKLLNKTLKLGNSPEDILMESLLRENFTPRLCIIFDDFTTQATAISKTAAFQELYFRGRHINITTLVCIHDYSGINKRVRTNSHNKIYGTEAMFNSFLQNDNKVTGAEKAKFDMYKKCTFQIDRYMKIFYSIHTNQYAKFKADIIAESFEVGSPFIRKYCNDNQKTSEDCLKSSFIKNLLK